MSYNAQGNQNQNYAPNGGGYPQQQQGGYPPQQQQGGYPPQQGGYPQQQGGNDKPRFSFINLKHGASKDGYLVDKDGMPLTVFAGECLVGKVKPARTTQDGKLVVTFSTPLSRPKIGEYIAKFTGNAPYENNGVVWADVTLFDYDVGKGNATRFTKLTAPEGKNNLEEKTVVLFVAGTIKVTNNTGNDGRQFVNCNIVADDFTLFKSIKKGNGGNRQSNGGGYPQQQGNPPQQGGGYPPQQGGGNPPQQGGYPPQQGGGYPPQQGGGYPQQQGNPPQQGGYPPQQGGGNPPQQGGGNPPQQQQGTTPNFLADTSDELPF